MITSLFLFWGDNSLKENNCNYSLHSQVKMILQSCSTSLAENPVITITSRKSKRTYYCPNITRNDTLWSIRMWDVVVSVHTARFGALLGTFSLCHAQSLTQFFLVLEICELQNPSKIATNGRKMMLILSESQTHMPWKCDFEFITFNQPAPSQGMDWWHMEWPFSRPKSIFQSPTFPGKSLKLRRKSDSHQISGSENWNF